jgi:tetratricopeptide (TPR) repeat protein
MKKKKIAMIIIVSIFIFFCGGIYVVVVQKNKNEQQEQQLNQEQQQNKQDVSENHCSYISDQEAYEKAIEAVDKEACVCIEDSKVKRACLAVIDDINFYKKAIKNINADECKDIKDEIAKNACVVAVKNSLEYIKNNKTAPTGKNGMITADYERIRKENPNDVENLLALAMTYCRESFVSDENQIDNSKLAKAFAVIEDAKKRGPNDANVYAVEGYALRLSSRNELALVAYTKSIELDGNNTEALKGRARIYAAQGNVDEALIDLEKATTLDKDKKNLEIYALLCSLYAKNFDREKATANCNIIINSGDGEEIRNEMKAILTSLK